MLATESNKLQKHKTYNIAAIIVISMWALSLYSLTHVAIPLGHVLVAILLPSIATLFLLYYHFQQEISRRLSNIEYLAHEVENRISQSLDPINVDSAPKAIKPLITSINCLIDYYEDRYIQERDFTANASHELRTPLAGIRLQTEIAMQATDEDMRSHAHLNILKAIDRGTRLVNQLLVLSRLTADRVILSKEAVNLGRIAAQVVADLTPLAEEKHINIVMHEWLRSLVDGNEDSLDILINNLVRNAIIYTPENGTVEVQVYQEKQFIILTVKDNGPGIPQNIRENVLLRFEKGISGSKMGSGLGLSIVKRIADLHESEVELLDNTDHQGLCVKVTLPIYSQDELDDDE